MQAIQPKVKALQEQYKSDPQQMNKAVMEMYRKNKVNPLGGCLPLLLQMPIFIALYQTLTQSIELRGAKFFWWIKDLSAPDSFYTLPFSIPLLGNHVNILPLLMIGSMIWQQKLTPTASASKEQAKMMLLMPVVFGFIFYNLPAGLVLYWFINNVLTILHQSMMRTKNLLPHHE
jgi:YidC/Oxa1 family membrane protein insertase